MTEQTHSVHEQDDEHGEEGRAAAFTVAQGQPIVLTIVDPEDGLSRQHVLAVSVLGVNKVGTTPEGNPSYNVQLNFAISPTRKPS